MALFTPLDLLIVIFFSMHLEKMLQALQLGTGGTPEHQERGIW